MYIQLVFAVNGRNSFIQFALEEALYKYITAVVQNDKHKMLATFFVARSPARDLCVIGDARLQPTRKGYRRDVAGKKENAAPPG